MRNNTIHATQIIAWLQKLEKNISNFDINDETSKEDKLSFLRHQHKMFEMINLALNGQVYFVGTSQDIRYMED